MLLWQMRVDRLPRIALIILIAVIAGVSSRPAQAHRPYFTRSKVVTLPDGRQGEMRIIAGDGIFLPIRRASSSWMTRDAFWGKDPPTASSILSAVRKVTVTAMIIFIEPSSRQTLPHSVLRTRSFPRWKSETAYGISKETRKVGVSPSVLRR